MNRLTAFVLLSLSLTAIRANANPNIHLPTPKQMCEQVDPQNCNKVIHTSHGQYVFTQPAKNHLDYYRPLRPVIIRIAEQYGVDPVALVLAPLAENTMNTNRKRQLETMLAGSTEQLDDDGWPTNPVTRAAVYAYLNHPLSIGPGQIYTYAAKHVEPLAARIEGRPLRKGHDIKEALMTPEGALRYAAAIMRDAQDTWAKYGYDITRRPEIVTTLYNLGKVEQLAKFAKAEKRQPLPNYFGYFAGLNYDYVQHELNLPSVFDQPAR